MAAWDKRCRRFKTRIHISGLNTFCPHLGAAVKKRKSVQEKVSAAAFITF